MLNVHSYLSRYSLGIAIYGFIIRLHLYLVLKNVSNIIKYEMVDGDTRIIDDYVLEIDLLV